MTAVFAMTSPVNMQSAQAASQTAQTMHVIVENEQVKRICYKDTKDMCGVELFLQDKMKEQPADVLVMLDFAMRCFAGTSGAANLDALVRRFLSDLQAVGVDYVTQEMMQEIIRSRPWQVVDDMFRFAPLINAVRVDGANNALMYYDTTEGRVGPVYDEDGDPPRAPGAAPTRPPATLIIASGWDHRREKIRGFVKSNKEMSLAEQQIIRILACRPAQSTDNKFICLLETLFEYAGGGVHMDRINDMLSIRNMEYCGIAIPDAPAVLAQLRASTPWTAIEDTRILARESLSSRVFVFNGCYDY